MSPQNYSNHVRWYPPHHFVFMPLIFLLMLGSAWMGYAQAGARLQWVAISAAFFMIGFAGFMMRQHYALGNQDRIVRLEMRLRYYLLTGTRLETYEGLLSGGQIAALRFASDEELAPLLQRALHEKLSPDNIKKAIRHWLPDDQRR